METWELKIAKSSGKIPINFGQIQIEILAKFYEIFINFISQNFGKISTKLAKIFDDFETKIKL